MLRRAGRGIIIFTAVFVTLFFFFRYGKESYILYGDGTGYYMYLPSTLIYHNHKDISNIPERAHVYHSVRNYMSEMKRVGLRTPRGYILNQYTYGVAALELPFFFIAHAYEKLSGGEANGYSAAYMNMIKLSAFVYAMLGLLLVYRVLREFFDKGVATAGTAVIFIGTNLFWFTLAQAGMAHVPLFFLYALLVYISIALHKRGSAMLFLGAGITAGLITVIRPTDVLCLFIPLLYNVYNWPSLKAKVGFLIANKWKVAGFAIAFVLPIVPQLLYWRVLTGHYIFYSYGGQSFDWRHPHITEGLFSFGNGWLVYSPVMAIALIGLLLYRRYKPLAWPIMIILPLYVYIIYSWFCFNYINGLGSRPMIHMYPLLAIPLTAFLQYLTERKIAIRVIVTGMIIFLVSLNVSYSIQRSSGILNSEESNMTYNLRTMFKTSINYDDIVALDNGEMQPDRSRISRIDASCENFEDSASANYTRDTTGKSRYVYHMTNEEYQPRGIHITYDKQKFGAAKWFRCSGRFMCTVPYGYYQHLMFLDIKRGDKTVLWKSCKINNKIGLADGACGHRDFDLRHTETGMWGQVYFFVAVPKDIAQGDVITLDLWNLGKEEIYLDDLCLELYK